MTGKGSPPPPSSTPDCTTSKDGLILTCTTKDDSVQLVELVEMYKNKGAWKQAPVAGRRQFINLDEKVDAANDHPEFGRPVWLKARLQWVSGDKTRSLAGKNIYWYAKPDKANNAMLKKKQKGSLDSAGGGKDKKKLSTDKDGWTKPIPYYLSLYGGDKFDIYATIDSGYKGGMKAGAYTVWRKFWFQVSEMDDRSGGGLFGLPGTVTTDLVAGYEKAKIEFSEKGPRGKIPHKGNTPKSAISKLGKTHFVKDDLVPFKCHLMTCDYGGQTTKIMKAKDKFTAAKWTSPDSYFLWPHDGPLSWKVEAKYKDGKAWKNIPDANLNPQWDFTQPAGYQKLEIDFSKAGSPVMPSAKAPVDVKFKLKCAGPNFYYGWGGGSAHILLCTGMVRDNEWPKDGALIQRSDAVHEIGHALGLVNMPPTKAGAHNAFETKDKKHKKHCKEPGTSCAMYWGSSTTRLTTFHSIGGNGCNEHLRTQDFSRSVMKPLWK
ncbi:MAG: hypothetical protein MUO63_14530 [Desulfobulbaceae bacterium]|nr:hypothetical protein [Desulfobulbaceae bacterium]